MRAHKVDENQAKIVAALRRVGATVLVMSELGHGAPDLAVGIFKRTFFLEVKNPDQPKSAQSLTADEAIFADSWKGHYAIVRTPEEAIRATLAGLTMPKPFVVTNEILLSLLGPDAHKTAAAIERGEIKVEEGMI
jgi:hypothetical protein